VLFEPTRHFIPALLDEQLWFPDPRRTPSSGRGAGLVAVGGDFSVPRLLLAYRSGIFPWSANPITWWSPDPRAVLELNEFHISRSLARVLRQKVLPPSEHAEESQRERAEAGPRFHLTRDLAFAEVIEQCASQPRSGHWIDPEFVVAYTALHHAGHAHSVECWKQDELVGGIYGVTVGGVFAGESMFHRASSASKVALWHLVEHLRARGFVLFDLQMLTPTTTQFGGKLIPRDEYLSRLENAVQLDVSF
jgi:leucyl/phenylalanyl-tRNA---protein transferase